MKVSVIIPVWNGRLLLEKLLDSLDRQTLLPAEVLIVDNGSRDGAPEMAERRMARVIRLGHNTGFAHAVNRGIQESRNSSLAIVNSDVELHPEWLQKLSDKHALFATGKILSKSRPEILDGTYDLLCRGGTPWRAGSGKRDVGQFNASVPIESASFTAALFSRDLFDTVGLLDERFESYLEDVDFGLRCAAQGLQGVYVPDAVCHHFGSATLGRWHGDSVRRMARNQIFLISKHYPPLLIVRWAWLILIAQLLWGIVATRHGAGFSWICGKWDGFRHSYRTGQVMPESVVRGILARQEKSLRRLQGKPASDWYWRTYFFLTSGAAK